jgi:hypothetical protein
MPLASLLLPVLCSLLSSPGIDFHCFERPIPRNPQKRGFLPGGRAGAQTEILLILLLPILATIVYNMRLPGAGSSVG